MRRHCSPPAVVVPNARRISWLQLNSAHVLCQCSLAGIVVPNGRCIGRLRCKVRALCSANARRCARRSSGRLTSGDGQRDVVCRCSAPAVAVPNAPRIGWLQSKANAPCYADARRRPSSYPELIESASFNIRPAPYALPLPGASRYCTQCSSDRLASVELRTRVLPMLPAGCRCTQWSLD